MRHWLIAIRKDKKFSQYEVADKAGISQSYYAGIETGNRGSQLPVETAKTIAQALGFDWTRFYDNEDKETA